MISVSADKRFDALACKKLPTLLARALRTSLHVHDLPNLDELLGEGVGGRVYKARWRLKSVAAKVLKNGKNTNSFDGENTHRFNEFVKEAAINAYLGIHAAVIPFFGPATNPPTILMQVVEGCSLEDALVHQNRWALPTNENFVILIRLCIGAADGLVHLHGHRIIHRDVSARNFIVNADGSHVYICDYGLSELLPEYADYGTTPPCGATRWMSPESFTGLYHRPGDVFAFGVFLWEVFTRMHPFLGVPRLCDVQELILRGARPPLVDGWPEELKELITRCVDSDPDKRPSMLQAMSKLVHLHGFVERRGLVLPVPLRDCNVTRVTFPPPPSVFVPLCVGPPKAPLWGGTPFRRFMGDVEPNGGLYDVMNVHSLRGDGQESDLDISPFSHVLGGVSKLSAAMPVLLTTAPSLREKNPKGDLLLEYLAASDPAPPGPKGGVKARKEGTVFVGKDAKTVSRLASFDEVCVAHGCTARVSEVRVTLDGMTHAHPPHTNQARVGVPVASASCSVWSVFFCVGTVLLLTVSFLFCIDIIF